MRKECELYEPIKAYFQEHGYTVNGEVKNIDLVASKGDDVIAVELKPTFNLKLILQAVDRQKMFDSVYVAIFKPKSLNKRYKEMIHLLKRLELGLIVVNELRSGTRIEIEHHPLPFNRQKNHRKKRMIINEVNKRTGLVDNTGGTTKEKRITAYREDAIAICVALTLLGDSSPKHVKTLTGVDKSGGILYSNFYGWYERIGQGVYRLSNKGFDALKTYYKIADHFNDLYIDKIKTLSE